MSAFIAVSTNPVERIAEIDEAVHSARVLRWNASQMGDAAGFGRVDRMLDALYAERDGITALHPRADFEGRVLLARRRAARAA